MKKRALKATRAIAVWLISHVDQREVLVFAGLALIWLGLRDVSSAAALAIPGAVLVWLALPPRPPFIGGKE